MYTLALPLTEDSVMFDCTCLLQIEKTNKEIMITITIATAIAIAIALTITYNQMI